MLEAPDCLKSDLPLYIKKKNTLMPCIVTSPRPINLSLQFLQQLQLYQDQSMKEENSDGYATKVKATLTLAIAKITSDVDK